MAVRLLLPVSLLEIQASSTELRGYDLILRTHPACRALTLSRTACGLMLAYHARE